MLLPVHLEAGWTHWVFSENGKTTVRMDRDQPFLWISIPVLSIVKTGYYRSTHVFSLCPIAPFTELSYADIVSPPKDMQQSGLARLPLNYNCLIEIIRGLISAWLSKVCSLIKSVPVEIAWIIPSKRPVSEVRLWASVCNDLVALCGLETDMTSWGDVVWVKFLTCDKLYLTRLWDHDHIVRPWRLVPGTI